MVGSPEPRVSQAPRPVEARSRFSPRFIAINVVLLAVLVGAGILGYNYFSTAQNYITTDNANIDGTPIPVSAPAAGLLVKWQGGVGTVFHPGDVMGQIQPLSTGSATGPSPSSTHPVTIPIIAPQDGTIAVNNGVVNTFVVAGTPLATMYDLRNLFVTARVQETDIRNVKPGQMVDITIDAFSDTKLSGTVEQIGYAAASVGSLLPPNNTTGNYQKVTQVIPVTISIADQSGLRLVPGMNCTVKIHK